MRRHWALALILAGLAGCGEPARARKEATPGSVVGPSEGGEAGRGAERATNPPRAIPTH